MYVPPNKKRPLNRDFCIKIGGVVLILSLTVPIISNFKLDVNRKI